MAYQIPQPIIAYNNPAPILPALTFREPREGKCYIPVEIRWDGTNKTQQINVQGLTTQPFSQIVMIDVDNNLSGAEVTFYFNDSQDTLTVPPGSSGLFPVFTGQLTTYVSAPGALASDITRFRFLNYRQEPIGLPPPQFTNIVTSGNLIAAGTTALLAPAVSGTLVGYSVNVSLFANIAVGDSGWRGILRDHTTGATIEQAAVEVKQNSIYAGIVMNVASMAYRFSGGIDFEIINTGQPFNQQSTNVSLRYRTP